MPSRFSFDFPVENYPTKITSLSFDKDEIIEGVAEEGKVYEEKDFNRKIVIPARERYRVKAFMDDAIESEKLLITPLAYIRGRSISNVIFIVDEAQNLTPHEVKTIITRAGEGTKVIFTGDINQIDTPYMDEHSNGLTYLIDRLKGNALFAHIKLEKGERSELANLANEML